MSSTLVAERPYEGYAASTKKNIYQFRLSIEQSLDFDGLPIWQPLSSPEALWIWSIFLENNLSIQPDSEMQDALFVVDELYSSGGAAALMTSQNGFSTAKFITFRKLLGVEVDATSVIENFEVQSSFRANCDIFAALLSTTDPLEHILKVEKLLEFLCHNRMGAESAAKLDMLEHYSDTMFLTQSLVQLLEHWERPLCNTLPEDLVKFTVPIVLLQALTEILGNQNPDGSWGQSYWVESTSYAIIALGNLISLPYVQDISKQVKIAIDSGRQFLTRIKPNTQIERTRSGKVTHCSIDISRAYQVAALKISIPRHSLSPSLANIRPGLGNMAGQFNQVVSKLPHIKDLLPWVLSSSCSEACLYVSHLKKTLPDIFQRRHVNENNHFDSRYFDLVVLTIIFSDRLAGTSLRPDILKDIMVTLLYFFEYDDFVEHVLNDDSFTSDKLKKLVGEAFGDIKPEITTQDVHNQNDHDINSLTGILQLFSRTLLQLPGIQNISSASRKDLKRELKTQLKASFHQINDSKVYYKGLETQDHEFEPPKDSFYRWLHTTSHQHAGLFPFFTCLVAFITPQYPVHKADALTTYLIQDVVTHIAIKARLLNDNYSLRRDRDEKCLNVLDFPQFGLPQSATADDRELGMARQRLQSLIEYEARCIDLGFDALKNAGVGEKTADISALRFLNMLSDLQADFYAMKADKR